jgi:hypothetical protein
LEEYWERNTTKFKIGDIHQNIEFPRSASLMSTWEFPFLVKAACMSRDKCLKYLAFLFIRIIFTPWISGEGKYNWSNMGLQGKRE